ncbi:MAG: pimeloyl-ACP methyl ester esterase BioH [Cocleimonas sp.]|nr:pimeloyl-ACP methyl ester esterase BioH [Cocleimonas sp.]
MYTKKGVPDGDPLLVLHGWGMNASVWQMIANDLECNFQVIWLDLPGHGDNHHVCANNIDDIIALILPLLTQPTHLMGWSLGGLVAQGIVQLRPDLIKRVVMIASTPKFTQTEPWQNAMPQDVLAAFSKGLLKDTQGTIKRFIALQFMGIKDSQLIQRELRQSVLANLPNDDALQVGLNILQQQDFRDLNMSQEQLWILGGKDRLIPIEIEDNLRNLYPDAQVERIESAGHAPFMTHPQLFIKLVINFLMMDTNLKAH